MKQVVTRLKTINRSLTLFPATENTELSKGALIDILVRKCPKTWSIEMARNKFDPAEHSLDDVMFECERLEIMGDINDLLKSLDDNCFGNCELILSIFN